MNDTKGNAVTPKFSYLICATPRCGSTFLSKALSSTRIAGCPEEHFEVLLETGRPRRRRRAPAGGRLHGDEVPQKGAKEDLLAVLKGVVNLAGSGGGAGDVRGADILASPFFIP